MFQEYDVSVLLSFNSRLAHKILDICDKLKHHPYTFQPGTYHLGEDMKGVEGVYELELFKRCKHIEPLGDIFKTPGLMELLEISSGVRIGFDVPQPFKTTTYHVLRCPLAHMRQG